MPNLHHSELTRAMQAGDLDAVERLLRAGLDLAAVSQWWAPGFGTRQASPDAARLLVDRGAALSIHAAAGFGLRDHLARMLAAEPALVHAKGGDGCTPLHFARDPATARLLLEHGAKVDARDDDHDSTPAQWLIGDAPEITRLLIQHGAAPDIFMAAALGDLHLAARLIDANPECLRFRIGSGHAFPPIGHRGRGGTIYQWTLAFNSYAHQVALLKGHVSLFDFLYERSDSTTRLLVDCVLARCEQARAIAAAEPGIVPSLPDSDRELVARYCWETNINYEAVKLMLDLGFPVSHPERSHGYTPLHNAAWAGSGDLVDLLISRGHPLDIADPRYHATPLGFALHDCLVEKRHPEGEFARVVRSLLNAGSPFDPKIYPSGNAAIDDVLRVHLDQ